MGRAPCCDKSKVTKGPWTPAEDFKLISFIQTHGHPNWRSLPQQAGLLRCGKSCRLRWMNYLRPDVKRGNWTPQEEEKIINLHRSLGNRWSKIAAKLPGRTDNEIKNVWNTHLKKKLKDLDHDTMNDRFENDIHKITSPSESKEYPHSPSSTTSNSSCISYGDIFNLQHDTTTTTNIATCQHENQNDVLDVDIFWNTVLFTTASNSNDGDDNILTKPWQLDVDYSQTSMGTKCCEDGGGYEEWLRYLEDELGLVEDNIVSNTPLSIASSDQDQNQNH